MKYLNKKATKTMNKLISMLENGHCKIDNSNGAFMPVVIEKLYDVNNKLFKGTVYSVAHYFEQNGDLCCDPDVTFLEMNGYYIPMTFEQQGELPIYQKAIMQDDDGTWKIQIKAQKSITSFCNTIWFKNIKQQQKL